MSVRLSTILVFIVLATIISCRNSGTETGKTQSDQSCLTEKQRQILQDDSLENALFEDGIDYDDSVAISKKGVAAIASKAGLVEHYGKIIPYSDAKLCIDSFQNSMEIHGIDEGSLRRIDKLVKMSTPITYFEGFRGKELRRFIRQAARKHSTFGNGRSLAIHMTFGMYTRDFALKYFDSTRIGRICIFLVTKKYKEEENKWVDDGVDDDAFNFGGIHP